MTDSIAMYRTAVTGIGYHNKHPSITVFQKYMGVCYSSQNPYKYRTFTTPNGHPGGVTP